MAISCVTRYTSTKERFFPCCAYRGLMLIRFTLVYKTLKNVLKSYIQSINHWYLDVPSVSFPSTNLRIADHHPLSWFGRRHWHGESGRKYHEVNSSNFDTSTVFFIKWQCPWERMKCEESFFEWQGKSVWTAAFLIRINTIPRLVISSSHFFLPSSFSSSYFFLLLSLSFLPATDAVRIAKEREQTKGAAVRWRGS